MTLSDLDVDDALRQWGATGRVTTPPYELTHVASVLGRGRSHRSAAIAASIAAVLLALASIAFLAGRSGHTHPAGGPSSLPPSPSRCISITITAETTRVVLPDRGQAPPTVHLTAPAQVRATMSGSCVDELSQVQGYLSTGGRQIQAGSGRAWTIETSGTYLLSFQVPMCAGHSGPCFGGLAEVGSIKIIVE